MHLILLQTVVAANGFEVDPAWVVATAGTVFSTLTGTVAFLYRGQIAALRDRILWLQDEGKRKDARIDLLIDQIGRLAETADRTVALAETRTRSGYR